MHSDSQRFPGQRASMRPGEMIHYYTNFLTLLRGKYSPAAISDIATASVSNRERCIEKFDECLDTTRRFFDGTPAVAPLPPYLQGWQPERIRSLRDKHGGMLLALFHYGEHRHVLSDLCLLGIPFVAPVAKHSYFDATTAFSNAPADCADAPMMLEVESRNVGRKLLTAIKRGRIGAIYVDGNMGPDGHLVEESGVEIEFFGRSMRVKAGIARLAISMRLPILPVIAVPDSDMPNGAHRLLGLQEILPLTSRSADVCALENSRSIMQSCYDRLAAAVETAPQHWEFAFCLHRWLSETTPMRQPPASLHPAISDAHLLSVDPTTVIPYPRDDAVYWVHVERQRAYRIPNWSHDLYERLSASPRPFREVVLHLQERAGVWSEPASLLHQLCELDLIQAST